LDETHKISLKDLMKRLQVFRFEYFDDVNHDFKNVNVL
jgi:hypothetical protein